MTMTKLELRTYFAAYELRIITLEQQFLELRYNHNHDDKGRFCSGGGGGNSLDKSGKSDIMKDSSDNLIKITQKNIDSIPECTAFSSKALNQKVTEKCKEILSDLKNDEVGTEETVSIKLSSLESEKQKGESGEGAVKVISFDEPFVSIHNHPSGETFSGRDIDKFAYDNNHVAMCVIGNNGKMYVLQKKSDYNWTKFAMESFDIQYKEDYAEKVLNGAENYGFEYHKK